MTNPLILGPLILGLVILLVFGWRREMARRRTKAVEAARARQREALGEQGMTYRPEQNVQKRSDGVGQIALVVDGSYGSGILPFMLRAFQQIGAASHVGMILVLELDVEHQQRLRMDVPTIFRDRLIFAECPLFSVGMSGDTIEQVWQNRELWMTWIRQAVDTWMNRMQRETQPGLLWTILSPGGSAALARPALQAFAERYPHLSIYGTTIVDDKTVVRERFPQMRDFYEDLVRGWIINDNRRHVQRTDLGLALYLASMVGASWIGVRPLDIWNGAAYMFPRDLTRVATLSVWAEMLPVRYLPGFEDELPPIWFTQGPLVEEKAIRGIKAVADHPELQGLPLEPAGTGVTRITCVVVPVVAEDLQTCRTHIDTSLEEWREHDPDLSVQYASMGVPLTPETTETLMVVMELQPIAGGLDAVEQLALGAPVDAKFLPQQRHPRPAAALPSRASAGAPDTRALPSEAAAARREQAGAENSPSAPAAPDTTTPGQREEASPALGAGAADGAPGSPDIHRDGVSSNGHEPDTTHETMQQQGVTA